MNPESISRTRAQLRTFWIAVLTLATLLVGTITLPVGRAAAADENTTGISKELAMPADSPGYDPETGEFQTGSLVYYRLKYSCSSLTNTSCGVTHVTDVLAPQLTYVSVQTPNVTNPTFSTTYNSATRTVDVAITSLDAGMQGDVVLIAKINAAPPFDAASNSYPIHNTATITPTTGLGMTSNDVVIKVSPPADHWFLHKMKTAPTGNPAYGSNVSYIVRVETDQKLDNKVLTAFTIVDTYPACATVVSTSTGAVVDAANHTITYTRTNIYADPSIAFAGSGDTTGHLYNFGTGGGNLIYGLDVTLNFPAGCAGTDTVNRAKGTFTYNDNTTSDESSEAAVTFDDPVYKAALTKTASGNAVAGQNLNWVIDFANTGNTPLTNVVLTDTLPTTYMESFALSSSYPFSGWTVEVSANGTTWTTITGTQAFPDGTTLLRVSNAGPIQPGYSTRGVIIGVVKADTPVGTVIQNCVSGKDANAAISATPRCPTVTTVARTVTMQASKLIQYGQAGAAKPGELVDVRLLTTPKNATINNLSVADLLPAQLEYVSTTCIYTSDGNSGLTTQANCLTRPPVLSAGPSISTVGNRQLLTWNLDMTQTYPGFTTPGIPRRFNDGVSMNTELGEGSGNSTAGSLIVWFKARVREATPEGSYTNDVYVKSNMSFAQTCASTSPTDPAMADMADWCHNTADVVVIKAAIIAATKWDDGAVGLDHVFQDSGLPDTTGGSCPDWGGFTRYPCVAQTTPGGKFEYKWRMVNTGNMDMNNYVVYDILPYVGDTGTIQTQSQIQRGTEWSPTLNGPVTVLDAPAGANPTVLYNYSSDPCRPELFEGSNTDTNWQGANCADPVGGTNPQNTWYTAAQVTDWSLVRSFKMLAFQAAGDVWTPGDEIVLHADMTAPATAPKSVLPTANSAADLSIAWNSIGHRVYRADGLDTGRELASEPPKVGVIITAQPIYDLALRKTITSSTTGLRPGDLATYKIEVFNQGDVAANDITITDYIPSKMTFSATDQSANYPWVADTTAGTAALALSGLGLAPGTSQSFEIKLRIADTATPGLKIDNFAEISADDGADIDSTPDTNNTNDVLVDDVIDNTGGDEDDHDIASVTIADVVPPATLSLGDLVWIDANKDGQFQQTESPIAGVKVELLDAKGEVAKDANGNPVASTVTDADGRYQFDNLLAGSYQVRFTRPEGYVWTVSNTGDNGLDSDAVFTANTDATATTEVFSLESTPVVDTDTNGKRRLVTDPTIDAGVVLVPTLSMGDLVWIDANKDGVFQQTEAPISGVKVELLDGQGAPAKDADGNAVAATVTDANGRYQFDNLLAGDYQVRFTLPDGYVWTVSDAGADDGLDSDAVFEANTDATATTATFTLSATPVDDTDTNEHRRHVTNPTLDAGVVLVPPVVPTLSLGDLVWIDANKDGQFQQTESPISGVKVELLDGTGAPAKDADGKLVASTLTDADGRYQFDNLLAGDYQVRFTLPTGYVWTVSNTGGDGLDSDATYTANTDATATTKTFTLSATPVVDTDTNEHRRHVTNPTIDAGVVRVGTEVVVTTTTTLPTTPTTPTTPGSNANPGIVTTTTVTTSVPQTPKISELPRTGGDVGRLVPMALVLLLSGGVILLVSRRRRSETL